MRKVRPFRISYLPSPDEEVEGQVMNPAREQQPRIGKEAVHLVEGSKTTRPLMPVGGDHCKIEERKQRGKEEADDKSGDAPKAAGKR